MFPATAATVVAFVDDMGRVKTPATVRRYVASLAIVHKALRQPNPLESARVRFALQRMHRRRGRRQAQVHGLTWPLRTRLLAAAGDRLIDARNRALLAVGYDTLLRRSELVSLDVSDVLEDIDGTATLLVRAGKTDPDGRGAMLYLARDTVQLVTTWLERGGVGEGRLFRAVRKDGTVAVHGWALPDRPRALRGGQRLLPQGKRPGPGQQPGRLQARLLSDRLHPSASAAASGTSVRDRRLQHGAPQRERNHQGLDNQLLPRPPTSGTLGRRRSAA